jgi:hypothetical protein
MKHVSLILPTLVVVFLFIFGAIPAAHACGHAGRFGGCLAHGHFDPTVREYATDRSSDAQGQMKPHLPKRNSRHSASAPNRRVPAKW